jgi:hypothetical protein
MLRKIKQIIIALAIVSIALKASLVMAVFLYPNITSTDNIEAGANELINMTNQYRLEQGLNTLTPNARLTQAAANKARDLLTNQYFAHTSPDGKKFSQWIKDVDYKYFYVGENLAIDFNNNQEIFQAWLNSPAHKENIARPQYQEIGIAVIEGKYKNRQTAVAVQLFGSRIVGTKGSSNEEYVPLPETSDVSQMPPNHAWHKITSLKNLERLDDFNNYILIILVGLYLASYTPVKRKAQINIKQPIINRYQAKIFRE